MSVRMTIHTARQSLAFLGFFAVLFLGAGFAFAQDDGGEVPVETETTDEGAGEDATGNDASGGEDAAGEAAGEEPEGGDDGTEGGDAGSEGGDAGTEGDDADSTGATLGAEIPQTDARALTNQRLREIGGHVDALKEDTFATKSRLLLLRESVLGGSIAGSNLIVYHQNDMGAEYTLVQVRYSLDGEQIYGKLDYDGKLEDNNEFEVFNDRVVPGSRNLTVQMVYKGSNWGIFRYMDGYTFTVTGAYQFTAEEGMSHSVTVRAYEGGGFFTPYEERPTFDFNIESQALETAEN